MLHCCTETGSILCVCVLGSCRYRRGEAARDAEDAPPRPAAPPWCSLPREAHYAHGVWRPITHISTSPPRSAEISAATVAGGAKKLLLLAKGKAKSPREPGEGMLDVPTAEAQTNLGPDGQQGSSGERGRLAFPATRPSSQARPPLWAKRLQWAPRRAG